MPDPVPVLAVLVTALALVAAVALATAHRAAEPAARAAAHPAGDPPSVRRAMRSTARRGGIALAAAVVALVGSAWVANGAFREAVGDAVFAAPVLAGAVGAGVFGMLQSRPLITGAASPASLVARRTTGFARTRSFVAAGALVLLLLALVAFSSVATPFSAPFAGPRLLALLVLLGALVLSVAFALRRVAERAALPAPLRDLDVALRRTATRFVLLLATAALLAPIALVALQSGVWLWGFAAVDAEAAGIDGLVGAFVTAVGAAAAVGSLASFIAVVVATATHSRSGGPTAAPSAAVEA